MVQGTGMVFYTQIMFLLFYVHVVVVALIEVFTTDRELDIMQSLHVGDYLK